REARASRADRHLEPAQGSRRHVGARRDPHGGVQELSHGDAERLQPADQLRHARQPAGVADCGETKTDRMNTRGQIAFAVNSYAIVAALTPVVFDWLPDTSLAPAHTQ